jgi:hypothetical protein
MKRAASAFRSCTARHRGSCGGMHAPGAVAAVLVVLLCMRASMQLEPAGGTHTALSPPLTCTCSSSCGTSTQCCGSSCFSVSSSSMHSPNAKMSLPTSCWQQQAAAVAAAGHLGRTQHELSPAAPVSGAAQRSGRSPVCVCVFGLAQTQTHTHVAHARARGHTQVTHAPASHLLHDRHLWRRVLFALLPAQRDERGQAQVTNLDLACVLCVVCVCVQCVLCVCVCAMCVCV